MEIGPPKQLLGELDGTILENVCWSYGTGSEGSEGSEGPEELFAKRRIMARMAETSRNVGDEAGTRKLGFHQGVHK